MIKKLIKESKREIRKRVKFVSFRRNSPGGRDQFVPNEKGWAFLKSNSSFISIHLRPKQVQDIEFTPRRPDPIEAQTAIIIQGKLLLDEDFTLETVQIYKKIFPLSPLIVSTWIGSDTDTVEAIRLAGAEVLLNEDLLEPGLGNIMRQICSTSAGLQRARELSCTHAVKTRTDWRMMRPSAVENLHALLRLFPRHTTDGSRSERIIASSTATLKHRVYGLTDIFHFGAIGDLLNYWAPSIEQKDTCINLTSPPTIIRGTAIICEIYLCARYLENLGITLDFTLEQWWDSLRKHFIVVDNAMLDALWRRHNHVFEYRFTHSYALRGARALDHLDWLQLMATQNVNWDYAGFQETWTYDVIPGVWDEGGIIRVSV